MQVLFSELPPENDQGSYFSQMSTSPRKPGSRSAWARPDSSSLRDLWSCLSELRKTACNPPVCGREANLLRYAWSDSSQRPSMTILLRESRLSPERPGMRTGSSGNSRSGTTAQWFGMILAARSRRNCGGGWRVWISSILQDSIRKTLPG